jgi:hypothetical protein
MVYLNLSDYFESFRTERCGRVVGTSASYSGDPGLESRPGVRLSSLWWVYSAPPGKYRDSTLN